MYRNPQSGASVVTERTLIYTGEGGGACSPQVKDKEVIRSAMQKKRKSNGRTKMEGIKEIGDEKIQLSVIKNTAVLYFRAQFWLVFAKGQIFATLHRINCAGQS